jgi:hypothetical protein
MLVSMKTKLDLSDGFRLNRFKQSKTCIPMYRAVQKTTRASVGPAGFAALASVVD